MKAILCDVCGKIIKRDLKRKVITYMDIPFNCGWTKIETKLDLCKDCYERIRKEAKEHKEKTGGNE